MRLTCSTQWATRLWRMQFTSSSSSQLPRWFITTVFAASLLAGCASPPAVSTDTTNAHSMVMPASTYWYAPDAAMQSAECRAKLDDLRVRVRMQPTTAMMAVRGNRVLFAEGPISRPSQIASARKSLLAMLYGRPVSDGRIDLDATLAELGIDDL